MAQNFCSSCCCSFCGTLLFSSPPQSSQQQQQQPQPISSFSPPPPQSIAAHSPTSSPSQEPTPNMTDFKNFLNNFSDITQIDTLISFLEDLVKIASGEKSDGGSNPAVASHINDGRRILKMLDTRFGKRSANKNSANSTISEIEKVCIEGLKGSEKIPKVGIALCMLGSVLERFIKMSENKSECLDVLRRMLNLGKQIVQLNEQIPEQKEKLNEGVQRIIEGTIMCTSQLARVNIFRFITAQVSEKSLRDFQNKIDQLCRDIGIWTGIDTGKRLTDIRERLTDIGDRVPKIASESQKIYAYRPTVGIESAEENVIELLELNAQDPTVIVVVVYGFGGIGKTTLADAVYAQLNLQSYKHCRISMDQDCTSNDLKRYQQQILNGLFGEKIELRNCDEGQGRLSSFFKNNSNQPLFLYIDNGLKSTDLEKLLPKALSSCLPEKSRILLTTRNLQETNIFVGRNIVRREHNVSPLPETEARNLLLENVSDYNDEDNIVNLLKLCGGVPLLLELAGSQLAINRGNTKSIVLEMLKEGEKVKERDISDRMVGFVYDRLLPPVQDAFLDIASFFYQRWASRYVEGVVGEEELRALEAASFVKTDEDGLVRVHDIVLARGKKLSEEEGNRTTDTESLLECLKNDEKLKKLRGIRLTEEYKQPPIEINRHHLNCMSNSLRALHYTGSSITFREKCQKPFEQLRFLRIQCNVPDLPMEFEKLEHLVYYSGPMTQGMNLYEFPPSLRYMYIKNYSENRVAYSQIPATKVTPDSSLVDLCLTDFRKMQRLPDGLEKLTKLERLTLYDCSQLRELPSKLGDLKELTLNRCNELKELRSNFGQFSNLTTLRIWWCSSVPSNLGQLTNLEVLDLSLCSEIAELPSDLGQLQNLRKLKLQDCFKLEEWPLSFADLTKMEEIDLSGCSSKLKDSLPQNIKGNKCIILE